MGINKNFTLQTSAPAVTVAASGGNWATYYVNSSGILRFVHPSTTDYVASTFYPESGTKTVAGASNIVTGITTLPTTVNIYGTSGSSLGATQVILGEPKIWVKAFGPNGELLAIPAYTRLA